MGFALQGLMTLMDMDYETNADEVTCVVHIMYLDDRTREWLRTDTRTGRDGAPIAYSTEQRVREFADAGYALVDDFYPRRARYRSVPSGDQIYTVHLCSLHHGEKKADHGFMNRVRRIWRAIW